MTSCSRVKDLRETLYMPLATWYIGVMDETTFERFLDWCDRWGADPDDPTARAWYVSGAREDLALP